MTDPHRKATVALWVLALAVMAAAVLGYMLGKDMALRDNAADQLERAQ